MASKEKTIYTERGHHEGTLFRDGDRPVYLLKDGRFAVQDDNSNWQIRTSMKAIDNLVSKQVRFVRVFETSNISPDQREPGAPFEIVGWAGRKVVYRNGSKHESWRGIYVYDEALHAKLKDWNERQLAAARAFEEEFDTIMENAVHVYEQQWKDILKEHGQDA